MGVNKQAARVKHHTVTGTGSFTVPASEDFTDGTWDEYDLAKGELGIREGDDEVYIRVGSTIYEIPLVVNSPEVIQVAGSDETTDLAVGTVVTFRMPYAMTLEDVRASVTTAPTGANLEVDINESGVSVLSTVISIDAGEKTSTTAATPPVISDSALADDAEITIAIDQIGSTVAGAGLKVTLIGRRA